MKVVAYGQPEHQRGFAASLRGLERIGWEVVCKPSRQAGPFTPEPSSFAIVEGVRSFHSYIFQSYLNSDVPLIIAEYGFLKRAEKDDEDNERHWQLSFNHLGWVPQYECGPERFKALGIEPAPWRQAGDDAPVILCGDHPGGPDETHDFKWPEIRHWALTALEQIKAVTDRRVFWRPHPALPVIVPGFNGISVGSIDWSKQWACVVHNSNAGNEALFAGCPVFTDGTAGFREVARNSLSEIENPIMPCRADYLNRLAHGQWTLKEITSGKPFLEYQEKGLFG